MLRCPPPRPLTYDFGTLRGLGGARLA